jgi:hypothetical protein
MKFTSLKARTALASIVAAPVAAVGISACSFGHSTPSPQKVGSAAALGSGHSTPSSTTEDSYNPRGITGKNGKVYPTDTPSGTVHSFYAATNDHDYRAAWDLGGKNYGESWSEFSTHNDSPSRKLTYLGWTTTSVDGNRVHGKVVEKWSDGEVTHMHGYGDVKQISDGSYRNSGSGVLYFGKSRGSGSNGAPHSGGSAPSSHQLMKKAVEKFLTDLDNGRYFTAWKDDGGRNFMPPYKYFKNAFDRIASTKLDVSSVKNHKVYCTVDITNKNGSKEYYSGNFRMKYDNGKYVIADYELVQDH